MDIVTSDKFDKGVARTLNWSKVAKDLANPPTDPAHPSPATASTPDTPLARTTTAGWKCSPVTIDIPYHSGQAEPGVEAYTLKPGFWHRSLISVIREKVEDPDQFDDFHTTPYQLFFQPNGTVDPIRVHGELYTSDEFLAEHQKLNSTPSESGCELEKVVVGLMFASDVTHLTQFGDNKLWPVYLAFGNDSKYMRAKPSKNLVEHVASLAHVRSIS